MSIASGTLQVLTGYFSRPAPAAERPFSNLSPFEASRHWDLDSTPDLARKLSRWVGTRTPEVEAAIIMASLKHDVRYYYGGSAEMKRDADEGFAQEIQDYGDVLGVKGAIARIVADVDRLAVDLGGGAPFDQPYSWGYGLLKGERRYVVLATGEQPRIEALAKAESNTVIQQLATGTFAFTEQQLSIITPEIRDQLRKLAQALLDRRRVRF